MMNRISPGRFYRLLLPLVVAGLGLFSLGTGSPYQGAGAQGASLPQVEGRPVVRGTALAVVPASDNAYRLREVTLTTDADDNFQLHLVTEPPRAKIGKRASIVIVDRRTRVYRAAALTASLTTNARIIRELLGKFDADLNPSSAAVFHAASQGVETLAEPLPTLASLIEPPCQECEYGQCSGWGKGTIITYDPAAAPLNITQNVTDFEQEDLGGQCRWFVSIYPYCWADPNTFIGTEWFVNSCNGYVVDDSMYQAHGRLNGSFWNDDWFLDSWRTWVYTQVDVQAFEGLHPVQFSFDWFGAGDSWWILVVVTKETWGNSCW